MKTVCFLFMLGLLVTEPSFDTFASITKDVKVSKGKVTHFMDATLARLTRR